MPKPKPIKIFANVSDKKIIAKPNKLKEYWALIGDCFNGERIEISISPVSKKRSLRQNAYLWGGVYSCFQGFLAEHQDYRTTEEIHEFFKVKFLPKQITFDPATGEKVILSGSTVDKDKFDFSMYVEQIREYCFHSLGLYIPTPEDYYEEISQNGQLANGS